MREQANARTDTERLDWAEHNPDAAMAAITGLWANLGRGWREKFCAFRHAIDQAMDATKEAP